MIHTGVYVVSKPYCNPKNHLENLPGVEPAFATTLTSIFSDCESVTRRRNPMFLDTLSLPLFDLFDEELDLRSTMCLYVFLTEDRLNKVPRPCTRKYPDMIRNCIFPVSIEADGQPAQEWIENGMVLVHMSGVQNVGSLHEPMIGGIDFTEGTDI